jgi:hypothetical protein
MNTANKLIAILAGLGLLVLTTICSYHSTDSTEVGVRTRKWVLFGKPGVEEKVYLPGSTYFFLPIINEWTVYDTKLEVIEMKKDLARGKNDELAFKTIEGNDLHLDIRYAFRIDANRAPYIRQHVGSSFEEIRDKVFKTVVRSRTRDFFGELTTQQFYNAEERNVATEQAKQGLQEILKNYGIILESVSLMDYRFNDAYSKIIEQKKVSEQNRSQIEARMIAQKEANTKLLNEAHGTVNGMIAHVDGVYTNTVAAADTYFDQQKTIADATLVEGKNKAETIKKQREAMASAGGETQVRMKIAENLKGKRIIMMPVNEGSMNLNTMDVNKFLEMTGIRTLGDRK